MGSVAQGTHVVRPFDDFKTRVAKLKANCGQLLRQRPRPAGHRQTMRELDEQITGLMAQAAADPIYADDLLSASVTVLIRWEGTAADVAQLFQLPVTSLRFAEQLAACGGEFVRLVPAALVAWGYELEDEVLDEEGYLVGSICTDQRATRLAALLHREFAQEIRTRRVEVERRFYGYHFPDLLTVQQAESYLRQTARQGVSS